MAANLRLYNRIRFGLEASLEDRIAFASEGEPAFEGLFAALMASVPSPEGLASYHKLVKAGVSAVGRTVNDSLTTSLIKSGEHRIISYVI
ncbi:MAG: hypothetical protein AAF633_10095 [Chloroflexota bacterium]